MSEYRCGGTNIEKYRVVGPAVAELEVDVRR